MDGARAAATAALSGINPAAAVVGVADSVISTIGNIAYGNYAYDKARADAIKDRDYQNAYNHPKAQMARLQEAGLNPRLVYGKGADALMQPVRGTPPPSAEIKNPLSQISTALALENTAAQNKLIKAQAENVEAQTRQTQIQSQVSQTDYDIYKGLRERTGLEVNPNSPGFIKSIVQFIDMGLKAGKNVTDAYKLYNEMVQDDLKVSVQNKYRKVKK